MPKKPNYDFEKRLKETARKQKQEEKRARKREEQQAPAANQDSASETLPVKPTE